MINTLQTTVTHTRTSATYLTDPVHGIAQIQNTATQNPNYLRKFTTLKPENDAGCEEINQFLKIYTVKNMTLIGAKVLGEMDSTEKLCINRPIRDRNTLLASTDNTEI